MGSMLTRAANVVAAGLLLGSCAASSPRPDWREQPMLLDATARTDAGTVKPEQLFDD